MRTALEALFDAMINDGWANESSGDVEAPTGHFACISNSEAELAEILAAFTDVTDVYGLPDTADIIGHFLVVTNNQGFIDIESFESADDLKSTYRELVDEYDSWMDDDDED